MSSRNNIFSSNFLGIVVQNNDPEKRGRVKVFVPHINIALYTKWNQDFKTGEDKHFVFPDKATNPDLDLVMDYLKNALPWAEIALPPFGGASTGRYNAALRKGSTSDSNAWEESTPVEGFRPLVAYTGKHKVSDAFYKMNSSHNRLVNPNANQYTPSDYSNLARGFFTIPNVGSHVWIFFVEGDINYPVVFASSYGQEDWKRIYSKNKEAEDIKDFISPDYPESYENLETAGIDHNKKTFRSKHVFNSNKHSLEFIDTDHAEVLKFTHYSGSFFEMNNNTTTRFSTNNDQTLVIGDQFITIRKCQGIYIAGHQENIIDGDRITKLGDFEKRQDIAKKILAIMRDTHDYKMLFEIMRTENNYPFTSFYQSRDGVFDVCPVCGGSGIKFDNPCITCDGTGLSPSSQWGNWKEDAVAKWVEAEVSVPTWNNQFGVKGAFSIKNYGTSLLGKIIHDNQKQITQLEYEGKFGNGGDDLETVTGNKNVTIGTVFNDLPSFRVDEIGKIRNQGAWIAKEGTYVTMAECPLVEYVDVDSVPGGDYDVTAGNRYRLNVGSRGIHLKTTGPVDIAGTIMNIAGEAINISSEWETLIEGKRRVEIRGDIINLKPHDGKRNTVLVDGNLGVRSNLLVVGGAHIEGNFSFMHLVAPQEHHLTEIGYGPLAHTHRFKAPSWVLKEKCSDVRDMQQTLNRPQPMGNFKCAGFWVPS